MTFADFQFELLSHEILLENQQHPTLTPETGTFALYTNKQGSNNFNTSDCSNHSPRSSSSHPAQNQHFKNFNFHQESKPARKLSKSARKLSLTHRSTFCSSFPIHATPTQDSNSKYESCAAQLYPKAVDKKTTLIQSPSPKLES